MHILPLGFRVVDVRARRNSRLPWVHTLEYMSAVRGWVQVWGRLGGGDGEGTQTRMQTMSCPSRMRMIESFTQGLQLRLI
jgi:hypothetical protein